MLEIIAQAIAYFTLIAFLVSIYNKISDITTNPIPTPTIYKSYISSISISETGSSFINNKIKGTIMALTLTDTQQAAGTLSFVDKKGNATDVADGAVTVTSSDESIATVSYLDDGNVITVVAGKPGVAALTIKATNQAGEDLPFEDVAIEVLSGNATAGTVTFGDPTEQA